MARDLGTKHTCFKCQTKFYDLKKPAPVCPKCGADQREAPVVKPLSAASRRAAAAAAAAAPAEEEVELPAADEDAEEADEDAEEPPGAEEEG